MDNVIEELRALLEKVPATPWEATDRHGFQEILGPRDRANWFGRKGVWAVAYVDTERENPEEIAALIVAAVNALPDLLSALASSNSRVVELEREVERVTSLCKANNSLARMNSEHRDQWKARALAAEATAAEAMEVMKPLSEAVLTVLNAIRSYLPPDGIGAQECLNIVIGAIDNPRINPIIKDIENGHR